MSADFHEKNNFPTNVPPFPKPDPSFASYLLFCFQLINYLANRPPPPLWDILGSSVTSFSLRISGIAPL